MPELKPRDGRKKQWPAAMEMPPMGVQRGVINPIHASEADFRFTYFKSAKTMFLNDTPLIKGMPSALLLKMLTAYVELGQNLFFLHEFRCEKEAGIHSNLEARLARLEKRLAEKGVGLRLVRLRGCRRIECEGKVELKIV